MLSEEGLATIEHNADTILEQVGIEFRDAPDALERLTGAGCDIDGERVRFPRGSRVSSCRPLRRASSTRSPGTSQHRPPRWHRDRLRSAYGSPFVRDLDGGRRYGTIEDFRNFVKLAYATPYLHHSGGTVCEPVDLPVNKRHYDMVYAHLRYSTSRSWGRSRTRNAPRTPSR